MCSCWFLQPSIHQTATVVSSCYVNGNGTSMRATGHEWPVLFLLERATGQQRPRPRTGLSRERKKRLEDGVGVRPGGQHVGSFWAGPESGPAPPTPVRTRPGHQGSLSKLSFSCALTPVCQRHLPVPSAPCPPQVQPREA